MELYIGDTLILLVYIRTKYGEENSYLCFKLYKKQTDEQDLGMFKIKFYYFGTYSFN